MAIWDSVTTVYSWRTGDQKTSGKKKNRLSEYTLNPLVEDNCGLIAN